MSKNIEINYKSDVGYEVLYPSTTLNSVIDWQENLYSKDEILDSVTKALYGLGTDAVPDEVFSAIYGILSGPLIQEVSYTGTGRYGSGSSSSVTFSFAPGVIIAMGRECDGVYIQRFGCEILDKTNCFMSYTKFLPSNSYERFL